MCVCVCLLLSERSLNGSLWSLSDQQESKERAKRESVNCGVGGNSSTVKRDPVFRCSLQIYNHSYQRHLLTRSTSSSGTSSLVTWVTPHIMPSFTRLTAGATLPCNYVMSYHHQGTFAYNNPSHTSVPQGGRHYFCQFQRNDLFQRNYLSWFRVTHRQQSRACIVTFIISILVLFLPH